jgi:two-component system, cell cycle response regulator DivK
MTSSSGQSAGFSAPEEDGRDREARRILIVEDDEDSRNVYRLILEHGGFRVIEARTGLEGMKLASTERPDLILMDISIPGVDGWEATRILKQDEGTRLIPIIILTAHQQATDRERAQEAGCDGYLTKPVPPSRVLREVEQHLLRVASSTGGEPTLL